jgi:ribose transport system permease protein
MLETEPLVVRPPLRERITWRSMGSVNAPGLLAALIVLFVVLSITTEYFFSVQNALNILHAVSFVGVASAVATLVLVGGGIDLSTASVMALAGTVVAGMLEAGYPMPLAVCVALLSGLAVGAVNAVVIVKFGINPLIATIGTQFVVRGLAYLVVGSREILITDTNFTWWGQANFLGIPVAGILMMVVFVFFGWLMRSTVFGRHIYAIGGTPNGVSAMLAGVPVKRRLTQMYMTSGLFSAVAGLMLASYTGDAAGFAATGLELPIVSAVILGGTALGGGRGTVWGTLAGVMLVGVISNGLTLNSVSLAWLFVVQGAILVVAVIVDERRQAKS